MLQGIEEYKGKKIIYSLGNFVYGGAKNPADKDSIIYQVRFAFNDGQKRLESLSKDMIYITHPKVEQIVHLPQWSELHSFIPVRISGERSFNNYQPIIAEGVDKERIIKRMDTYSSPLNQ